MTENRWVVSVGKDGSTLHLYKYDRRARFRQGVEDAASILCDWTGGRLFGHGFGDWAWRVPLGLPKWDPADPDDPYLSNSLASILFDLEQKLCRWTWDAVRGCEVQALPITEEQAVVLAPSLAFMFEDDDAEESA